MPEEPHLEVYDNRSKLVKETGEDITFLEGSPSTDAKGRLKKIKHQLDNGWFEGIINERLKMEKPSINLDEDSIKLLDSMVSSVTSEVGRGVTVLLILQLVIKSIEPSQCIRLHKAGRAGEDTFSWQEGVPMRVLDKAYITPVLRKYDLMHLNADGFMMTRSLAENYPYSRFYKAAIRGSKREWIRLVDRVEDNQVQPLDALKHIIGLLINRSDNFKKSVEKLMGLISDYLKTSPSIDDTYTLINRHIDNSTYSARLFEIAMHSFLQAMGDLRWLESDLVPLSQMRSANKKHGNIGDIELSVPFSKIIDESWDSKYGKPYLRDELEELLEKIQVHPDVKIAGFVVDGKPDLRQEIRNRIQEIEELTGVKIYIMPFKDWVRFWITRTGVDESKLAKAWLLAYAESIGQLRRDRAPIDEPSDIWVQTLIETLSRTLKTPRL